jgi:hypothetical protein
MRVCPKCGYIEEIDWRPTTWKSAQYIDCCRVADLENLDPELASQLKAAWKANPGKGTIIQGIYAYRITKPGIWVFRRWIDIFKIQGWAEIPAEQHKAPKQILNM